MEVGVKVSVEDNETPQQPRARRRSRGPTFQHRLEYVAVRVVGAILRTLPVGLSSAVMGWGMGLVMPLTSRHRRSLDHLALALPELPEAERQGIARRMWRNLGRVSGEAFQIDRLVDDLSRVTLPADFERFETMAREGGIIAGTAHLGNWEITGVLPRRSRLPFAAVYQALHNPYVEDYLKSMRAPAYPDGLFSKGGSLGHTLVRLAREGVSIGMVADLRELRGIPVRFFNQEAYATPLPAMLARLTDRPLVAGAILRTRGVHFEVVLEEIPVPVTDDRDADIAAATQAMHDAFERWIRRAPDQWMWSHRKWARARPAAAIDAVESTPAPAIST